MSHLSSFLDQLQLSIQDKTFVKLSLGNYQGDEQALKNIYIKPILIKQEPKLSFTYRYKTKDITKNYLLQEGLAEIQRYISKEGFHVSTLFSTLENQIVELGKNGEWRLRQEKATAQLPASLIHDKTKSRILEDPNKQYLKALRLTDKDGKVFKNAQDKWKQINHYIEILSTMLKDLPQEKTLQVVDMGSGKGYLTFALYDYLHDVLQRQVNLVGVEYRADMVDLCNKIAKEAAFENLSFVQGTIEDYQSEQAINVLIALHACDTATDDAIFKGIQQEAELIVVAPCCHKQIRREMETYKTKNELDFLLQHGIFLERQAEMLTDGMRALILAYHGYQTKVFQFVADAHTPKNVLIVGVKKTISPEKQAEILAKIKSSKAYFGIGYHHLERLTGLDKV